MNDYANAVERIIFALARRSVCLFPTNSGPSRHSINSAKRRGSKETREQRDAGAKRRGSKETREQRDAGEVKPTARRQTFIIEPFIAANALTYAAVFLVTGSPTANQLSWWQGTNRNDNCENAVEFTRTLSRRIAGVRSFPANTVDSAAFDRGGLFPTAAVSRP